MHCIVTHASPWKAKVYTLLDLRPMLTSSLSANLLVPALQKVTVNTGTVRDLTTTTWEEAVVNVKTRYMHE